jgi:tetratricopeptide (TPR) repeat protein
MRDLFAALYRHYASDFAPGESPVGDLVLRSKYDRPLRLKVSLMIPRFMDFSTDRIVNLPPGEKKSLPLRLELNDNILGLRENSVEQMLVSLQYYIHGELKENKFSRGLTIYGRNAMFWDDPRRIALYVTHLDPDIETLAKAMIAAGKRLERDLALDNNFIRAVILFNGLGRMGIRYLPDPAHPYAGLSPSRRTLDYVRYPRETLAGKAGDCDDIVVLYAALLQSIGVDTALVDVQDHIFLMFDTGLTKGEYRFITPDKSRVHFDDAGRVWVPLETTLVGQPFYQAWEKGLAGMERRPRTIIDVKEAWLTYQPVLGAAEQPFPGPGPDTAALIEAATEDLYQSEDKLLGAPASALRRRLQSEPGNTAALNRLGVLLGRKGYLGLAAGCFNDVMRLAPDFPGGWSNLANIHYEKGEFPKAVELYRRALELDPANAQVHVEIALTYAEMGDFEQARRHYLAAVKLNPEGGAAP